MTNMTQENKETVSMRSNIFRCDKLKISYQKKYDSVYYTYAGYNIYIPINRIEKITDTCT